DLLSDRAGYRARSRAVRRDDRGESGNRPDPSADGSQSRDRVADIRHPADADDGQHPAVHRDRTGHDLSSLLFPATDAVPACPYDPALKRPPRGPEGGNNNTKKN